MTASIDLAAASGEPSRRVRARRSTRAVPETVRVRAVPFSVRNVNLIRVVSAPSLSFNPGGRSRYSACGGSANASRLSSSVAACVSPKGVVESPMSPKRAPSTSPSKRGVTWISASYGMLDRNGMPMPRPVTATLRCRGRSSRTSAPSLISMLLTEKSGVGPVGAASARSIRSWMLYVPSLLRTRSTRGRASRTASNIGARCRSDAIERSRSSVSKRSSVRPGSRSASAKSVSRARRVNGLNSSLASVAWRPSSRVAMDSSFAFAIEGRTKNPTRANTATNAIAMQSALRSDRAQRMRAIMVRVSRRGRVDVMVHLGATYRKGSR